MKKNLLVIMITLLIISLVPMNIAYGNHVDSKYLDIKIGANSNSFTLSSNGGFYIHDKLNKDRVTFEIMDTNIIISSNSSGDLDIIDSENNIIESIPGDGTVIIGSSSMRDSIITIDKNQYRGFISFIDRGNGISLINHINIEEYLYGVVPKEVSPSFPIESIKAQAVAARTFAMSSKNKHQSEGFNLCDTTHCQVYGAVVAENSITNKAVDETKGEYVYYDGKLAETVFHSNNGGYIESSKDTWGGDFAYLAAKEDKFSANTTASTWELKLTNKEVNDKIRSAGINIGDILGMEVLERTEANRVLQVKIKGTLGEEIITGARLRTIFGMRSTWFDIVGQGESASEKVYVFDIDSSKVVLVDLNSSTILDGRNTRARLKNNVSRAAGSSRTKNMEKTQTVATDGFTIQGRGYGHGVGMSQYGAVEMAKEGYPYDEILKYYYNGVDIIYNGQ